MCQIFQTLPLASWTQEYKTKRQDERQEDRHADRRTDKLFFWIDFVCTPVYLLVFHSNRSVWLKLALSQIFLDVIHIHEHVLQGIKIANISYPFSYSFVLIHRHTQIYSLGQKYACTRHILKDCCGDQSAYDESTKYLFKILFLSRCANVGNKGRFIFNIILNMSTNTFTCILYMHTNMTYVE